MSSLEKTVLVVEDNDINMKLFHDVLDARGYNVLVYGLWLRPLDIVGPAVGVALGQSLRPVAGSLGFLGRKFV